MNMWQLLYDFHHWGWLGILSRWYPVYWKQDFEFKNSGYDILSLKEINGYYFRGKLQDNPAYE